MIRSFETTATRNPQGLFLRFRQPDDQGNWFDTPLTYQQVRLQVGALLGALRSRGLQQGAILASDMQNCPAFVYLFLACMYGGFTLVTLNDRLTSQEKEQRVGDLAQLMGEERKTIDAALRRLKAEGRVASPKRGYYQAE